MSKHRHTKIEYSKPAVSLNLMGPQGNAFVILGIVSQALRRESGEALAAEYHKKATSSDYDNLIKVTKKYVKFKDTSRTR